MKNAIARFIRKLFRPRRGGVSIPEEWRETQGEGVTVLVIDSGAPARSIGGRPCVHHDLAHSVAIEECRSFVHAEDIYDSVGHATAVCGIIAASGHNREGVVGYAPKARVVCYKVAGANGRATATDLRLALEAAAGFRPDIVCVGITVKAGVWKMHDAIRSLESLGIPVVCAAGNDGGEGVLYPARFAETIAVGACDADGKEAPFSARGPEIDCLYPGVGVRTLWKNDGYAIVSGTSFAAPAAAAVAALQLSFLRRQGLVAGLEGAGLVARLRAGTETCTA